MNTDFRALCAELHAALEKHDISLADDRLLDRSAAALRAARRPKPPSLKEQALEALENLNGECLLEGFECPEKVATIRRALESLPDWSTSLTTMTELSPTAKIILVASAKANCLQEWDHVNDPPCHPDDPDWNGCYTCIHRAGIAAALRAAADKVVPEKLESYGIRYELLRIAEELEAH